MSYKAEDKEYVNYVHLASGRFSGKIPIDSVSRATAGKKRKEELILAKEKKVREKELWFFLTLVVLVLGYSLVNTFKTKNTSSESNPISELSPEPRSPIVKPKEDGVAMQPFVRETPAQARFRQWQEENKRAR